METLQGLGAALFVLLLLGAVLFVLRQRGIAALGPMRIGSRSTVAKQMEVLERVVLGPRHSLFLVRVGGARWMVATSPDGCQFQKSEVTEATL